MKTEKDDFKKEPREKIYKRFHEHHGGSTFGAFFLLTIGVLLLFNNFGLLPWGVWVILLRFWPILLIVWGVEIAFGKSPFGRLLVSLISLLLLASALIYSLSFVNKDFDNWIGAYIPKWKQIKKDLPTYRYGYGTRVFRCDPFTDSCEIRFK